MERLFGFLNIDKPRGLSSREVVNQVQRSIRPTKVGHSGTLDPMAAGVLVLCVGRATRLTDLVHRHSKSYRATFRFGCRSDTDDATGNIVDVPVSVAVSMNRVRAALESFVGEIEQRPPTFSAVHVNGKRAYRLARKGQHVEIATRHVVVHKIELVEFSFPNIVLKIDCGSGTYIRAIGRDLGEKLGCGAIMTALTRTSVGPFNIENAMELESLVDESRISQSIRPATQVLEGFPFITCTPDEREHLCHGRRIPFISARHFPHGEEFASQSIPVISATDEFVCLARVIAGNELAPKQVFATD